MFDMDEALAPGAPDRDPLGQQHVHVRGPPAAAASATATSRPGSRRPTTSSRASTAPAPSSTRRSRRPAASRSPRPTAGSPSTPTPRRSTSASTTPRSSCRCRGNRLRFIGGTVGGGFGGKVDVIVEPLATLGAMKTGRPGALRLQPLGGDAGHLHAQRLDHPHQGRRDGGRDASSPARSRATRTAARTAARRRTRSPSTPPTRPGPYAIPNVSIDAYCVYTNRTPTSAPCAASASRWPRSRVEVQMDKIAERVGLDPWTVRFRNALPQRGHQAAPQGRPRTRR